MTNTSNTARYSFAQFPDYVSLLGFWHYDAISGAACWREVDRESFVAGKPVETAWDRLRERNRHLLNPQTA